MATVETIQPEVLTPWARAISQRARQIQRSDDLNTTATDCLKLTGTVVVAGLLATTPVTGPRVIGPVIHQTLDWYTRAVAFLNPSPENYTSNIKPQAPAVSEPPVATEIPLTAEPETPDNSSSGQGTGGPVLLEPAQMVEAAKPTELVTQPPVAIVVPTAIPTPRSLSIRELPVQSAYSEILTESDWKTFYDSVGFYARVEGINPSFLWELFKCENRDGKRMDGLDIVKREGTHNGTVQIGMGQITPAISLYAASGMTIPEQRRTFSPEKLEELYIREAGYLANPAYAAMQAARLVRKLDPYQQFPDCTRRAVGLVGSIYAPE